MAAYLDHAATTPLRPEARDAMAPLLHEVFGNPSGSHRWARQARRCLDDARDQIAAAAGVEPDEVVLTSGGTEADNLAIAGAVEARRGIPLCSATEHHAVLAPVLHAGGRTVATDRRGAVDLDALQVALADPSGVAVVSVIGVNNETGLVQPLADVVDVVRNGAP